MSEELRKRAAAAKKRTTVEAPSVNSLPPEVEKAKLLIQQKDYDAARKALAGSTHEKAVTLLERLNAKYPPVAAQKAKQKPPQQSVSRPALLVAIVMIVVIVGIIGITLAGQPASPPAIPTTGNFSSVPAGAGKWLIQNKISSFDDTRTFALVLYAENEVQAWLDTQLPTLVLRCQERTLEAYINTKAQFHTELDENLNDRPTFRFRFDSEKAYSLRLSRSTDGEAAFLGDAQGFIQKLEIAKILTIGFTPFSADPVETTFDLAGLKEVDAPLWTGCPKKK